MENLSVDTDTTRSMTASVRAEAHRIRQAVADLQKGLEAIGPCWGTSDETAHAFQQSYEPKRNEVLEAGRQVVTLLQDSSDRVNKAMTGYENAETDNTHRAAS
ncbi:WXG100 family type VII secretion target [Micromonospora echinofusca]|uniref:WXG100 family type VII secretion target n=1 Tax=Micromonospora echinofusca TaxID=47858 RepID=A0ABS3VYR2_MICEH|nr:WXG100 family type VII secretion target [Micromonospora echinofusca]MBO4209680.1 hypothetical protein [Micromonospora echinofusca]